jgi:ribosomal protein S18 acetylase RimI-like enzyme
MIIISKNLQIEPVLASDCKVLYNLMSDIYPPAYAHFWKDNGNWYVNSQYSTENILKEIENENAAYYFIVFNNEIVGNFRFVWDEKLANLSEEKQVKLHRLYLHPNTQGNGIGKKLVTWLIELAKQKEYQIIWLDAMKEQPKAFEFYQKLGFQYLSHTFLEFNLMLDEVRKMSQLYLKIGK